MSDVVEGEPGWFVDAPWGDRVWMSAALPDVPDLPLVAPPDIFDDAAMRYRIAAMLSARVIDPRAVVGWNGSC